MENATAAARPERKVWIDLLRGLALLFVIYGHQVGGWYPYFLLTSPVKIPLFFAITGYLFREDKSVREFLATLLWRLLVPWLLIGVLSGACRIPFTGLSAFKSTLLAYAKGKAAWFVPCCVVAEAIWYVVRRTVKSVPGTAAVAAVLCAAGIWLARRKILNEWMINRAMAAQAYLLVGLVYRRYLEKLPRRALWGFLALGAYLALAALSWRLYPRKTMDVHQNWYYNIPLCMGMVASGCAALFWLFQRFAAKAPDWMGWFGRNTLTIYLLHNASTRLPRWILMPLGVRWTKHALLLVPAVLLACALYGLAAALINRFAPLLAGRWRPGKRAREA